MTHTPGPWTQHGRGISKDSYECQYAIASCDSPVPAEEAEANAKLICAAPDLLAALQAAFDAWYSDRRHSQIHEPEWVGMARAAIAKAQGNEEA